MLPAVFVPSTPVKCCVSCDRPLSLDDLNYANACADGVTDDRPLFGDCCWNAHANSCSACIEAEHDSMDRS